MRPTLRDIARDFGLGEVTLESLRGAARAERSDRPLADEILRLITQWDTGARTDSDRARSREDLRARVKQLVPAAPATAPASSSRRPPGESIYEAGLRGQRRRP